MTTSMRNRTFVSHGASLAGNSAIQMSVIGTATQIGPLPGGVYDVIATADSFIKVDAANAADVTALTGYVLKAGIMASVIIEDNYYFGAITGSTSTITLHRVGPC